MRHCLYAVLCRSRSRAVVSVFVRVCVVARWCLLLPVGRLLRRLVFASSLSAGATRLCLSRLQAGRGQKRLRTNQRALKREERRHGTRTSLVRCSPVRVRAALSGVRREAAALLASGLWSVGGLSQPLLLRRHDPAEAAAARGHARARTKHNARHRSASNTRPQEHDRRQTPTNRTIRCCARCFAD